MPEVHICTYECTLKNNKGNLNVNSGYFQIVEVQVIFTFFFILFYVLQIFIRCVELLMSGKKRSYLKKSQADLRVE